MSEIDLYETKVNLHDTFDAVIWTQEWLKTIEKNPSIPTDEGAMIGWFANAIMAGYDHARHQVMEDLLSHVEEASGDG